MLNIVLVEPEIPQNCGNIARTCAATGSRLHLIRPLGFDISDRAVKRAGLDYWHLVQVQDYESLPDLFAKHPEAGGRNCGWPPPRPPQGLYAGPLHAGQLALLRQGDGGGCRSGSARPTGERCIRLPMRREARQPESQQLRGPSSPTRPLRQKAGLPPALPARGEMAE